MTTKKTKANPTPKAVLVSVPAVMPAGLERYFDDKGGGWRIKTKKGLKAFFDLLESDSIQ